MQARSAEWREARRQSIGGSDAAAIVGLNRYSTPFTVWADKTGALPQQTENERMRLGTYLEPYVADRFTEITRKRVKRVMSPIKTGKYPFAHANIDRRVIGEYAGLECKTTGALNVKRFRNGDYPDEYYVQCMHYLAVTGWDKWYLAVLLLGSPDEPLIYEIERDEDEIKALMDTERMFWETYVTTATPPPMDGATATSSALNIIYNETVDSATVIHQETAISNYLALQAQVKALKKERDRWKQMIQYDMGEYELAVCGAWDVAWKQQTRSVFDTQAFASDHTYLDLSDYYKQTRFRKFDIKEARR